MISRRIIQIMSIYAEHFLKTLSTLIPVQEPPTFSFPEALQPSFANMINQETMCGGIALTQPMPWSVLPFSGSWLITRTVHCVLEADAFRGQDFPIVTIMTRIILDP